MNSEDYPSLYCDADGVALETQGRFVFASITVIVGSIVNGALGISSDGRVAIVLQILLGVLVILSSCYLLFGKPQKIWYSTRALAESVKTVSWRYVMRAEPFHRSDAEAVATLKETVSGLLRSNDEVASLRFQSAHANLITPRMKELRASALFLRKEIYKTERIEDQLEWYKKKSAWNDKRSKIWYCALIAFSFFVLFLSLLKYDNPNIPSIDWLFSCPMGILAWIQIKRFQELASSYSLTTHEIIMFKDDLAEAQTEEELSSFVGNAENAFSREHTQWYARKDLA